MISCIPKINHLKSNNFFLIAGPCVVENEEMVLHTARTIKSITDHLKIPFIFKASFKKANRTKLDSFSGINDITALEILKKTGDELNIPVLTDIHESDQAKLAAKYADILQIPAFLCRQTELLIAAGKTGKPINIKKGQFVSANMMKHAVEKILSTGNKNIMLTERGTTFGYHDLVVDYRNLVTMQEYNVPVVLDCTHSLQEPNQTNGITGGNPKMIETIAKAGVAIGVDGLFIETHPEPANAMSDSATMLKLELLENLLSKLVKIRSAII